MIQRINHLSDFGSLGGVQSYLLGLERYSNNNIKLFSTKKTIDIYRLKDNNNKDLNINYLFKDFHSLIDKNEIFVFHNLILSKIWSFLEKSQTIFKKPIIYFEHGTAWHSPIINFKKYKKRISKVDCIIVNSNASALLLKEIYGINQKINILKPPIYVYKNNELDIKNIEKKQFKTFYKKDKIKLGYLGRLEIHKNPIFLLEISNYLKNFYNLNIEVDFIGSGSQKKDLEILSREMKVSANFFGAIDSQKKHRYVTEWDFAIFPSTREPLGLVQGEMALMNKLCLSSNIDGIPEVYPPSTPELLIDMVKNNSKNKDVSQENYQFLPQLNKFDKNYYPDIEDCAKKIVKLINNPKLYDSLLEKYKKFLFLNFSIEKHMKLFNNVMENYLIN